MDDLIFWFFFLGALSWVFGVAEAFGTGQFVPSFYRFGPVIERRFIPGVRQVPSVAANKSDLFVMSQVSENMAFIRAPIRFVGKQELRSNSPIKGSIEFDSSGLKIIGRLPVMPAVFLVCWLVLLSAACVGSAKDGAMAWLLLMLVGWSFGMWVYAKCLDCALEIVSVSAPTVFSPWGLPFP